jgi:SpoVK/Ycf46/Vps4 family AAA+-type ATPase
VAAVRMYGALRSGLRASPQRPPARFVAHRRYPQPPARARAFHAARRLAHDNNPPAGADSSAAGSHDADKPATPAAPDEDPDVLAQKLQRSRELTRRYSSALRRSQRRNRAHDLPPVVVPPWFAAECVRLSDDAPASTPLRRFVLELTRRGTDDAASCAIPIHAPGAAVQLLSEFLHQAWGAGLGADEKRRFVSQWAAALGLPATDEVLLDLEVGGDGIASLPRRLYWLQKSHLLQDPVRIGRKLDIDNAEFHAAIDHCATVRRARGWTDETIPKLERLIGRLEGAKNPDASDPFGRRTPGYVPPYVKAEVTATIAASLSASQPASVDAFPAAKTNVILHCPSNGKDRELSALLAGIAREQGADIVTLHAQDLAEIAGDYLGDLPEPSPHSIRSLAYETYRLSADLESDAFDEAGKDDFGEEQEDAAPSPASFSSMFPKPNPSAAGFKMPISIILPNALSNALKALQSPNQESHNASDTQPRSQSLADSQLEDLKIANVLEHLIDASETKRSQPIAPPTSKPAEPSLSTDEQSPRTPKAGFFSSLITSPSPSTSTRDGINIDASLPTKAILGFSLSVKVGSGPPSTASKTPGNAKIIYVPDYKELNATHYGGRIIQKLEEIVRKRRLAGERIMIVGTTSSADLTPEFSKGGVQSLQSEGEAGFYRTIVVPVERVGNMHDLVGSLSISSTLLSRDSAKYRRINIRHIFDMLRRLDPAAAQHLSARETDDGSRAGPALSSISGVSLSRILTYDEIHRIALTALGLYTLNPASERINGSHVALAIGMLQSSDQVKFDHVRRQSLLPRPGDDSPAREFQRKLQESLRATSPTDNRDRELERKLEKVAATATKHEKRLMPGIANPSQIKTTFDQIHVPTDTVDSIRTLTSLSLLRPDAFNYGVLATEKISGALLYGPPGTGKTLLAKAVAKESGSTVLEVSGSQIMDKYVGEGEKNVTAIFSLARKLSPCIVFLDEADAIFSSRDVGRERTSHRDILNQFLKEWDGLNDLSVFVMVATNRPFDLDDAVIRRLPRRLLVDLPMEKDRAAILKIHLRGEQLDDSVDLAKIAKATPFYSGSDLKNLAVSAALACVKEENETAAKAAASSAPSEPASQSASPTADTAAATKPPQLLRGLEYSFPDKRILFARHFDAALSEISASISENMSSLNAIKKFDEKYGDKKGKKSKTVFGIGVAAGVDEGVVRVRP